MGRASRAARPWIGDFMSKSSTATERRKPVRDVSTATPAGFVIHGESITVASTARIQLVDVTDRIMALVHRLKIREGMVSVWSMHTTCAVLINESQAALREDMTRFLEDLVAKDAAWLHNDPAHSDCSRRNADAHLRSMLLGHCLAIQVSGAAKISCVSSPRLRACSVWYGMVDSSRWKNGPAASQLVRVPTARRPRETRIAGVASWPCRWLRASPKKTIQTIRKV